MNAEEALKKVEQLEEIAEKVAKDTPQALAKEELKAETQKVLLERVMQGTLEAKDIPESIYKAFTRSVIGGAPFTHTFSILRKEGSVTFSEPKGEMAKEFFRIRGLLDQNQVEAMAQLSILTHLESVTETAKAKSLYSRKDSLELAAPEDQQDLPKWVNKQYAALFETLGSSLMRIIPQLWMIFSGVWGVMISSEVPSDF